MPTVNEDEVERVQSGFPSHKRQLNYLSGIVKSWHLLQPYFVMSRQASSDLVRLHVMSFGVSVELTPHALTSGLTHDVPDTAT